MENKISEELKQELIKDLDGIEEKLKQRATFEARRKIRELKEKLDKLTTIVFTLRNEKGLHCRFCLAEHEDNARIPKHLDLFETSPKKGIVCEQCKSHLEPYI